jgi:hypothetical protein
VSESSRETEREDTGTSGGCDITFRSSATKKRWRQVTGDGNRAVGGGVWQSEKGGARGPWALAL